MHAGIHWNLPIKFANGCNVGRVQFNAARLNIASDAGRGAAAVPVTHQNGFSSAARRWHRLAAFHSRG